jgi:hypothetical protein
MVYNNLVAILFGNFKYYMRNFFSSVTFQAQAVQIHLYGTNVFVPVHIHLGDPFLHYKTPLKTMAGNRNEFRYRYRFKYQKLKEF